MNVQNHLFWRSLIEVSGPFLEVQVLEEHLPQGFPKLNKHTRKKVVQAYNEWYEAVDTDSPLLPKLHNEWIRIVLEDLLEFDSSILFSNSDILKKVQIRDTLRPSLVLLNADLPELLIDIYPAETQLQEPGPISGYPGSAIEKMILLCKKNKCKLGLITNGEEWILINATEPINCGYSIWYSKYWWLEPVTLRAFHSLLEVRRFFGPAEEKLPNLFKESTQYTEEVTNSLGNQVKRAVEILVQSLDKADQDRNRELLKEIDPKELYDASLIIMMRLVFVLCAEERGLLLSGDPVYDEFYAVSTLRAQLNEQINLNGEEYLNDKYDAWSRLIATFRVLYYGIEHENFRLPPLGGSLFHPDKFPFLEGRIRGQGKENVTPLPVSNSTVLKLLNSLEILNTKSGSIVMSYKALNVEQIGHVYEGLLDYTVTRANETLVGLKTSKNTTDYIYPASQIKGKSAKDISEMTGRNQSSIEKDLKLDSTSLLPKLISFSGDDELLLNDISPYLSLLSSDSWGDLILYKKDSYVVIAGPNRRETGAHYTPKEFTEMIVKETIYNLLKDESVSRDPNKILDLKACDPAMGSGAFLVQVCDVFSKALINSWNVQNSLGNKINIKGLVAKIDDKELLPDDPTERKIIARRLVSEKCLYGVDINPMAVELSKLSLWLFTLSKGRPLEYLDHNLKVGDGLIGFTNLDQIKKFKFKENFNSKELESYISTLDETIEKLSNIRVQLDQISPDSMELIKYKNKINKQFENESRMLKALSDLIYIDFFEEQPTPTQAHNLSIKLLSNASTFLKMDSNHQQNLLSQKHHEFNLDVPPGKMKRKIFHWPLEFPEVFMKTQHGFDVIVGNPPFLGSASWKSSLGERYKLIVKEIIGTAPGKIDLCISFHLRAASLLNKAGYSGLIATSNIAEGDSANKGPGKLKETGKIIKSYKDIPWPGSAAVEIAIIFFTKGEFDGPCFANGKRCEEINNQLLPAQQGQWEPVPLKLTEISFKGINNSDGLSFIISDEDQWFTLLKNENDSILKPYISGKDITNHALLRNDRFALDTSDKSLAQIEASNPLAYKFLIEEVKPTRTEEKLKSCKGLFERWWQFWNHRAKQYKELRKEDNCIVFSMTTKHPICMLAPSEYLYTDKVFIVGNKDKSLFPILLSSVFKLWFRNYSGGKREGRLSISKKQTLLTFPFIQKPMTALAINLSLSFNDIALSWCKEKEAGLTDLVNEINNPANQEKAILNLRKLQTELDQEIVSYFDIPIQPKHCHRDNGRHVEFTLDEDSSEKILNFLRGLNKTLYEKTLND